MNIKSRNVISNKTKKQLANKLHEITDNPQIILPKQENIERIVTEKYVLYFLKGKPILFEIQNRIFPTIYCVREYNIILPKAVVDLGAIKYIVNGADVMAPGIVYFDTNIKNNAIIAIHEEKADSVLAIGISLINGEEFKNKKSGKVIKNVHHLNDDIWKFSLN
ncbi:MAG: DUF1947 domain-containing protein [Candidatus Heimdallarchaeaceae archaeon]